MEEVTILKTEVKPLLLSIYCPYLIYQMHAFKTKKFNSLGWHKCCIAYITVMVTPRNENFIVAETTFAPKVNCSVYHKVQTNTKHFKEREIKRVNNTCWSTLH